MVLPPIRKKIRAWLFRKNTPDYFPTQPALLPHRFDPPLCSLPRTAPTPSSPAPAPPARSPHPTLSPPPLASSPSPHLAGTPPSRPCRATLVTRALRCLSPLRLPSPRRSARPKAQSFRCKPARNSWIRWLRGRIWWCEAGRAGWPRHSWPSSAPHAISFSAWPERQQKPMATRRHQVAAPAPQPGNRGERP